MKHEKMTQEEFDKEVSDAVNPIFFPVLCSVIIALMLLGTLTMLVSK